MPRRYNVKRVEDIKVQVEFTEGYEERFTKACLSKLEQRKRRQQAEPPAIGKQLDGKVIA